MTQDTGSDYVGRMRAQGFTEAEIREALQASGWTIEQIEGAMAAEQAAPPPPAAPIAPDSRVERPPIRTKSREGTGVWVIVLIGCLGLLLAVGAVLAAIMFPVFARAREKAQQTSCLSNLKQIGLGQLMYAQDWDEHIVAAPVWPERLDPYTKNSQIYLCPSDDRTGPPTFQGNPVSYTMSGACGGVDLNLITSPAGVPLTYDGTQIFGGVGDVDFRHNMGANVNYVDGHAKWVSDSAWNSSWQMPLGGATPTPGVTTPPPPTTAPSQAIPMTGADASERARASACQSNLKQMALATLMYAQDYDEVTVPVAKWPEATYPYIKNDQIYLCPSDTSPHTSQMNGMAISYTMTDGIGERSMGTFPSPAEQVMLFDGSALHGGQNSGVFRHERALGVAYIDGHAKLLPEADWHAWWQRQPGATP